MHAIGYGVEGIHTGAHHEREGVDTQGDEHVQRGNNGGAQNERHQYEQRDRWDGVQQRGEVDEGSRTDAAFGTAVTATARVVGDRQRDESANRDGYDALVEVAEGQLEDALTIGGDPFPVHVACGEG